MHVFDPSAIGGTTIGAIDNVDYVDGLPGLVRHAQPTVLPRGASLLVSGWTVDPVTSGPPQAVCMLLDRARPLEARIGEPRGDIMIAHGTEELVGYQVLVSTDALGTGGHELRAYALSIDGAWHESAAVGFWLYQHDRAAPKKGQLPQPLQMLLEEPIDPETGLYITAGTPFYANNWILLRGWTFDQALGRGAETMLASDETGRTWSGPANLGNPAARDLLGIEDNRLGFEVIVNAAVLGRGRHRLELRGLDATGRRYASSLEVTIDIIAAKRPFPLTARIARAALPSATRLQTFEGSPGNVPLPSDNPIDLPAGNFAIEGWALDENGEAADEVFAELTATWLDLPPNRFPAKCGRRIAIDGIRAAPVQDAWFYCPFAVTELQRGTYELALTVVQPGRRSYSRAPLATIQIG